MLVPATVPRPYRARRRGRVLRARLAAFPGVVDGQQSLLQMPHGQHGRVLIDLVREPSREVQQHLQIHQR